LGDYSYDDLASFVLEELGVSETGQPTAAEDAARILNRLEPKLEELNRRDVGVIQVDANGYFEDNGVFLALVKIMAYECVNAFSVSDSVIARLTPIGSKDGAAERTIKDLLRLRTPRQTMRVEQFTRFRGNGRYRW
jgi:hypothetical protein